MTERIKKVSEILKSGQAALITNDKNRIYFTGFSSSAGVVLITKNNAYFLIDFRYFEKAKKVVSSAEVILCERLYSQLSEILEKESINEILIERDTVTLNELERLSKGLSSFNISRENTLSVQIEKLRSIKSQEEIGFIEKAQALTDEAFSYILTKIKPGVSEKQIALDMEFFMRSHGSEGVAFDFIVVSGKNSSLPHGVPCDKLIENGDFVTMDFGAVFHGYRSDMTRTVAVGTITQKQQEVYNTVLKAQKAAIGAIKPNIKCCEVDKIARDIISNSGYGKCFGHGLGHSVGLDIHESPACNTRDETPLLSGMIMTVEPGIYIENEFGVRIEDMVVVTDNGCRNLTKSPKELIIISS